MANNDKTVLIVYAHHYKKSLNATILDITVKALEADGCDVMISDLYAEHFNPLVGFHDAQEQVVTEDYSYGKEMTKAYNTGNLKDDIVKEQAKLSKADLVIFQFPLMWFTVPAILKGWLDRVLSPGYSFDIPSRSIYDKGFMKNKKAILSFTTGSPAPTFTSEGLNGDMDVILYPVHRGTLQFCGFDVLTPNIVYSTDLVDREATQMVLKAWPQRIPMLWAEEPIRSLSLDQFDFYKGGILYEDSEHRKSKTAPSVGTHCGKPISQRN